MRFYRGRGGDDVGAARRCPHRIGHVDFKAEAVEVSDKFQSGASVDVECAQTRHADNRP